MRPGPTPSRATAVASSHPQGGRGGSLGRSCPALRPAALGRHHRGRCPRLRRCRTVNSTVKGPGRCTCGRAAACVGRLSARAGPRWPCLRAEGLDRSRARQHWPPWGAGGARPAGRTVVHTGCLPGACTGPERCVCTRVCMGGGEQDQPRAHGECAFIPRLGALTPSGNSCVS